MKSLPAWPQARPTVGRVLFPITLFLSAALLFAVEPMMARMLLPALGGAAAVWTTCLVFFQATLLAGYFYAHLSSRTLKVSGQVFAHALLLAGAMLVLPIGVNASASPDHPVLWLLRALSLTIGVPFIALSATTPLVQSWFARARPDVNAYALYGASNLGSFAGLLAYPSVIEPRLTLHAQSQLWTAAYAVVSLLIVACGVLALRAGAAAGDDRLPTVAPDPTTFGERLRWIALASLPASLTLSVTTYVSTDLAAIPLIWILPLALYLASLVVAFTRPGTGRWARVVVPIAILPPVVSMLSDSTRPVWLQMPAHLLTFFLVSLACHQSLVRSRPQQDRLPEFYLWLALGSALGGLLTALVAPLAFRLPLEYPIGLLFACYAATRSEGARARLGLLDPLGPMIAVALVVGCAALGERLGWAPTALGTSGLTFGPALFVAVLFWPWPRRYTLTIAATFATGLFAAGAAGEALHVVRSFYGVHRVVVDDHQQFHVLVDGSTIHGIQRIDPSRRRECVGYYTRQGPAGQVFDMLGPRDVAVLGLGAGSLACYAIAAQRWTFFEIDPAVEALARNPAYFTYLADAPVEPAVIVGDARLSLARSAPHLYDLIVLDVFSSDAIPIHLLTREALEVYLDHLTPHGVVLFHISNLYLNLRPVVGAMAREGGLSSLASRQLTDDEAANDGVFPSEWVVAARNPADFGRLSDDPRWKAADAGAPAWTDEHASLLSAFQWGR